MEVPTASLKGPKGNSSDHERVLTVHYPLKRDDLHSWFCGPHAVLVLTGLPNEAAQHKAQLKVLDRSLWYGLHVQQEEQAVEGARTLRAVKHEACILAALLALRRTQVPLEVTRKVLAALRQLWEQQSKDMQRQAGIGQCWRCGKCDYMMEGPQSKAQVCHGCADWEDDQLHADELGLGPCICEGDMVMADCPRCELFGADNRPGLWMFSF